GRVRRRFRLEGLEDRNLLSLVKPSHFEFIPVGHRVVVPGPPTAVSVVTGQVSGTVATDGLYGGTLPGFSSYSGHGAARPFGEVLFGTVFQATASTTASRTLDVSNGSALFTTLKGGNQLRVLFTGVVTAGASGRDQVS